MSIASPLRFDRLQEALVSVVETAVDPAQVAWAYGEGVFDATFPSDFVNLTMLGGPSYHNRSAVSGTPLIPPVSVLVTVDTAVSGALYIITVNNFPYDYDASGGDTVTDIRDALLSIVQSDTESPYSAASSGADGIVFTPDTVGDIWQMAATALMTGLPTLSTNAVLVTRGTRTVTVSFGCFSKTRYPFEGAWDLAAKIQAYLTTPASSDLLGEYGVGVWGKGPAVDLSDLAGGHWESRVSFDATFAMQSVITTPVEQIEQVNMTVNFTVPTGTTGQFAIAP